SRMDFDDRGLADERDREHQPRHTVFAQELAADAGEGAAHDLDVHAFGEEWVRIVLQGRARQTLNRLDLGVRDGLGPAADPDEIGDPDDLQDSGAVDEGETGEAVAGKKWEGDFLAPILPPAPALGDGQERLDLSTHELIAHRLFVTRARPQHVPERREPLIVALMLESRVIRRGLHGSATGGII